MDSNPHKLKLALLVNMISPARIPLYAGLAQRFELLILHGGNESNRDTWEHAASQLPEATVKKAWGWQMRIPRRKNGRTFDHRYLHVTPGYLWQLLRFRPDVVVSNEMGLRTLIGLVYGTVARKPVWVWWGGTSHTESSVGIAKRMLRSVLARWAKHWISYGQSSTEYLQTLGIPGNSILEIQNAVDEQRFSAMCDAALAFEQSPVLLHVGQFTARKGIENLLLAAAELQKQGRRFSLVLIGSGPDKRNIERMAKELRLENIYFLASRRPSQMPGVYKSADMLIFPTLEDVWGLVANEAMLSGLPVLCSKYAGCAQELFETENIFDPENHSEFVHKLERAVNGELAKPQTARLRSTSQLVTDLARELILSAKLRESAEDVEQRQHV